MFKRSSQFIIIVSILLLTSTNVFAQKVHEPEKTDSEWSKPYPPFRIAGNLYYVGTYELACYLITTTQGSILINTGLASSAKQIKSNIESLGFSIADTKILLTTQAHFDHMGAMAAIKKMTGAKLMVDEKEADVLATGGNSDYAMGGRGSLYEPVKPDRLLHDSGIIKLGDMQLMMLHHPGHTKGSCSYLFTVKDEKNSFKVLIANLPTIIIDSPFASVTTYPGIASDYVYTLEHMKNISFDIWLASHASQFDLQKKHKRGDAYNPAAFIDHAGYDSALSKLQKDYDDKIKNDASVK